MVLCVRTEVRLELRFRHQRRCENSFGCSKITSTVPHCPNVLNVRSNSLRCLFSVLVSGHELKDGREEKYLKLVGW
jgi:hypothetical protein